MSIIVRKWDIEPALKVSLTYQISKAYLYEILAH